MGTGMPNGNSDGMNKDLNQRERGEDNTGFLRRALSGERRRRDAYTIEGIDRSPPPLLVQESSSLLLQSLLPSELLSCNIMSSFHPSLPHSK
jgi:hypothetical protein